MKMASDQQTKVSDHISKELLNIEKEKADSILLLKRPSKSPSSKYPGPGATFRIPQSSVLQRAKAFLPQMASANSRLAETQPQELDIENVDSNSAHVIEMNLAVVPTADSDSDSDSDSTGGDHTTPGLLQPGSGSQNPHKSDTDSEDSGNGEGESAMFGPVTEDSLRLSKSSPRRPRIEVMSTEPSPRTNGEMLDT